MQKIKKLRTIDSWSACDRKGEVVSHILLGLYDDAGLLNFVGSAPLRQIDGRGWWAIFERARFQRTTSQPQFSFSGSQS